MPLTELEELELLELEELENSSKSTPVGKVMVGEEAKTPSTDLQRQMVITDAMTMGFGDELAGALAPITDPIANAYSKYIEGWDPEKWGVETGDYKATRDYMRKGIKTAYEERPVESVILGGLGGLTPASGAVRGFRTLAKGLGRYGARGLPQKAAVTSGLGALSGGVYGYGSGEGAPEERLEGAVSGAGYGGLFGAGGAVAGRVVGAGADVVKPYAAKVAKRAGRFFTKKPQPRRTMQEIAEGVGTQIEDADVPITAVGKVEQAIKKDFPDNYEEVLAAWKAGDESLAETYGVNIRNLAKGAAQYPSGQGAAEEFFTPKVLNAPEKIKQSLSKNLSGDVSYYATVDDILNVGRKNAAPFYKKADTQKIKIDSDEALELFTSPEYLSAVRRAKAKYPSHLKGVQEDSVKMFDFAKRIMDDDIGKAKRLGEKNFVNLRTDLKNRMLEVADKSSPDYAKARQVSGDYLSLNEAMDNGREFFKVDAEILEKEFKKLSEQEQIAFKSGVGKAIRDAIDNTNEGANFYNKVFGKESQKRKFRAILSPKEYANLKRDMKSQDRLFKMRNEVLGGSPTVSKAQAAAELAGAGADVAALSSGGVNAIPRQVTTSFMGKVFDGLNDKMAKDVSAILYETSPQKKVILLDKLGKSKMLTPKEREYAKKVYFELDSMFNDAEFVGALTGGIISNLGGQEWQK